MSKKFEDSPIGLILGYAIAVVFMGVLFGAPAYGINKAIEYLTPTCEGRLAVESVGGCNIFGYCRVNYGRLGFGQPILVGTAYMPVAGEEICVGRKWPVVGVVTQSIDEPKNEKVR